MNVKLLAVGAIVLCIILVGLLVYGGPREGSKPHTLAPQPSQDAQSLPQDGSLESSDPIELLPNEEITNISELFAEESGIEPPPLPF